MSLVAYGCSDESSDEEGNNCDADNVCKPSNEIVIAQTKNKLSLSASKLDEFVEEIHVKNVANTEEKIHFDQLPKPKRIISETEDIMEDDDIPLKKEIQLGSEKPAKKNRVPVKITVPSLSEFKDVEKENETRANRVKPSNKGTKLFALLPPPKTMEIKTINNLVPRVVNKTVVKTNQMKTSLGTDIKDSDINKTTKSTAKSTAKSSIEIAYDSNSEDEDDRNTIGGNNSTDFFALSKTDTPVVSNSLMSELCLKEELNTSESMVKNQLDSDSCINNDLPNNSTKTVEETDIIVPEKTLVSNVMNLSKEEILRKNKAEVGPKLPIPEQEYNIDTEGNVAFDEKAIEYLCGKRGIKRKNKEIDEANVIEINGEDIKPDEREWLVKALTEEPVQRPVSMMGGVNSQSKKKHQITYLAHQAKAMEMELKNQWAQNRMTRKQTQSKYGF
ncbi:uncharacterized protein LOC116426917 [Nomia melanderi]|uniref:uncharacterized protein LOC116426917 n=1 Tax=Nomia melanderi TaxID=2448451 RepID=UPI00130449CB|nr:uncharacterized protein LOC116426917 [Nomia melanderi]XP_031832444.1 uncharacterized protein LOC116426917 [Nomia melanderi]XP_031832445.1 uncharacterized protein LOC116426917 [Nomia melanderi]